jgi:hypothetical protein
MPYILLRFCILGSVVGGGAFVVARGLASSASASGGIHAILAFVVGIPFLGVLASFLSVPIGLFPASIAGFVYGIVLRRYTKANPRPFARALLGGCIGGIAGSTFGGLFFSTGSAPVSYPFEVNLFAWSVAGIVGGAASALASGSGTYEIAVERPR